MKKKLFIITLVALLSVVAAGCGPGAGVRIMTPGPDAQGSTPAPNGEIVVPGVSIQLYLPGPNPLANTADAHGSPAGPLLGIWHGVISPFTLLASFIDPRLQMYEVHNAGNQYNLGFLVGVALVFLLLGGMVGSRRR